MPPRLIVEPVPTSTAPRWVQFAAVFRVPPFLASRRPALIQDAPATLSTPPATLATIVPWLTRPQPELPTRPLLPCTRISGPIVRIVSTEPPTFRRLLPLPPKTTVPVPARVWVPLKVSRPAVLGVGVAEGDRAAQRQAAAHDDVRPREAGEVEVAVDRHLLECPSRARPLEGGPGDDPGIRQHAAEERERTVHPHVRGDRAPPPRRGPATPRCSDC